MADNRKIASDLFASERDLRMLVGNITDYAIYMLDLEGRITSWNAGGERIKGYSEQEILGQHFSRFYTPADRSIDKPRRALQIARESGRYEEEGWRVRKDGSFFWASVVIDPIRDESGELIGFAKITRDISDRKAALDKLEKVQRQLAEAQKFDALGQLTGGVAHDFNNLLMIVLGSVATARKDVASEKSRKALERIEVAGQRAANLTRQLLTFARRGTMKPEAINFGARLESGLADVLNSGLGSTANLSLEISNDLWPITVDPTEFETALVNLVLNAKDAMPEGGTVIIKASNDAATDQVVIGITDTGAGIPDDVASKVFDPFFTTKPVGKGTGLGLSQVHGFVHQSGGTVELRSKLGEGTTVCIRLPRGAEPLEPEAKLPQHAGAGTVLLVEDNPDVAAASQDLLEQLGYRVRWVSDALSALQEIKRNGIDVVCSDIVMPGKMDGVGLAKAIRAENPKMPILLMTGYSDAAKDVATQFPILRKPYQLHELSRELGKLAPN
jgi:PAS domain S-box-containing protein